MLKKNLFLGWIAVLSLAWGSSALAETGVSDSEILIGVVNGTTGPIAITGQQMNAATQVAVDRINKAGGVHGRKIKVIYYDDGYEPAKTIEMTQKAIGQDKVFALMNFNGTPTAKAALPIANEAKVPFLFPRTGDGVTRVAGSLNVVNLRDSFARELEKLIAHIVEKKGIKEIAILTQADAFGDSIRAGTAKALAKRNLSLIGEGSVPRNSGEVTEAFAKIDAAKPKAVILGTTAAAAVPFIRLSEKNGKTWLIGGVNNNNTVVEKLEGGGQGVLLTQVTPHPETSKLGIARNFREDMKAAGKENLVNLVAFEQYINVMFLEAALRKAGKDLDREKLRKAFAEAEYDVGGLKASFSSTNRDGALPVELMVVKGSKIVEM